MWLSGAQDQDPEAAGLEPVVEFACFVLPESDALESPDLAESLGFADSLLSFSTRLRFPVFLKSVSYQPDPLSRKPATDTNFLSAG